MNELLDRLNEFRPKVAVCGDSILDEYYNVVANKVSPEFPIPILHSSSKAPDFICLGGAANVCSQFRNFNFDVSLFSLTNETIKHISRTINMDGCIFSRSVPVKKRYYSDGFPLCRIDQEGDNYNLSIDSLKDLQGKIIKNLFSSGPYDVIVFSDYGKGMFTDLRNFIPGDIDAITIVDPKFGPVERWKGCSIIKPNAAEAKQMTGYSDWKDQCEYFMDKTGCQAVVITDAGNGIVGNVQGAQFEHKPEHVVSAKSVVGAGDCFVAFLAMCMCHSIDIRKASKIAFDACSVYVQGTYNSPIYPYQIEKSKFTNPKNIISRDFSLAFTNGCFDILHSGHLELLKFAKSKADKLAVALNTDKSALRQNKKHQLINTLADRKAIIAALECVDFVFDFDEDTPYDLINTLKPDVLVKGSDWPNPIGSDIVEHVFLFDLIEGYSTTSIIEKIKSDPKYSHGQICRVD